MVHVGLQEPMGSLKPVALLWATRVKGFLRGARVARAAAWAALCPRQVPL